MATETDRLQLVLECKDDGSVVIQNFKGQVQQAFKVAGDDAEKFGRRSRTTFEDMGRSVTSALSPMRLLTSAMTALGGTMLVKSFIDIASETENYGLVLKKVTGSAQEAAAMFKVFQDYAGKTPFTLGEIVKGGTVLSATLAGGSEEVKKLLPMMGDLAAFGQTLGISFQESIGQISRMFSAGAASADLFREKGITAMLGFKAGVEYTAAETKKKFIAAWEDTGSKFRGLTGDLAKTWDGSLSMISDKWELFRKMVMDGGVFASMKAGVQTVLSSLNELESTGDLQQWATKINNSISIVADGLVRLGKIAAVGGGLAALPFVFQGAAVALGTLQMSYVLFNLELAHGTSLLTLLNTSLWGTSAAATAASGAMGALKVVSAGLFAAFAGWQIGSWLYDNFETARLAGLALVDGLIKGWINLKYYVKETANEMVRASSGGLFGMAPEALEAEKRAALSAHEAVIDAIRAEHSERNVLSNGMAKNTAEADSNAKATKKVADVVELTKEQINRLTSALQGWKDIIATASMSEYEKAIYKVTTEYDRNIKALGGAATAEAKATAERAKSIELMKLQESQLEKINGLMEEARSINATAGMSDEAKDLYGIEQKWAKTIETLKEESAGVLSPEELQGRLDELTSAYQTEYADKIADQNEKLTEESNKQSEEMFSSMRDFAYQAFSQIDEGAGSMLESILSKMKNWAASMAAELTARLAMNTLGSLAGMIGIGGGGGAGGGGILGLLGMGGTGGGNSGGGMDLMSILSGGKTAYNAYGGISSGSFYNTLGAGYAPGEIITDSAGNIVGTSGGMGMGINWLGAGAGVAGVGLGGYGMYNAYQAGSPGSGALAGAGAGLGVTGAMASGMLGSAAAGAAAGSWAPVIGTIIGAIVGAGVGALGMSGAKKEREEARLAENYYRGISRGADADISNMSLGQYVSGGSSVLSKDAVDAAVKLGGVDSATADEMYRVRDLSEAYKKAIHEQGAASAAAIGQYQSMSVELEVLKAKTANATGASRGLLMQFQAIAEKTKTLQIKQLTTDLQQGIGLFSGTIDKLKAVGMDDAEFNKLVSAESLKFLTTDTLPALSGELSKVREEYKKTSEEMKHYQQQQDAVAIKEQILASDMALTEAQLRTLKYGDVNVDLINLYTALGWTDKEIVLVTADTHEMVSVWEALSDAGKTLQSDLAGLAAQYKDVDPDKIPEVAMKTYQALAALSAELTMIGTAGQKLSALPDTFEAMKAALDTGDLVAYNAELLKVADSIMYLSGVAASLDMGKLATALSGAGGVLGYAYAAIEIFLLLQRTVENVIYTISQNDGIDTWLNTWLDKIDDWAPKFAKKFRAAMAGDDDVTGPIDFGMTYDKAIGVAGQYNPYSQSQIGRQAIDALLTQKGSILGTAMATGEGLSAGDIAELEGIDEAIKRIQEGLDEITAAFTKNLDTIIATSGMSDFEKQLFTLNDWYGEQKKTLDSLGLSTDDYNIALGKLNEAFSIQGIAAVEGYFDAIQKSITDYQTGLSLSKYNVFASPEQMGTNYEAKYQADLTAFNSGGAGDMGQNWSNLQTSSQAYLDYMFNLYGPTQKYQDVDAKIQQMLNQSGAMVAGAEDVYKSKYETDNIAQMTAVAGNTQKTADEIIKMRAEVAALQKQIIALNTTCMANSAAAIGKAVAANLPAGKR